MPRLDGGVFGRQAERVKPDGVEDVVALHPPEPGVAVRRSHDVPVADVQVARWVGVHGQLVPLWPGVVVVDFVQAVPLPAALPLIVDLLWTVTEFHLF